MSELWCRTLRWTALVLALVAASGCSAGTPPPEAPSPVVAEKKDRHRLPATLEALELDPSQRQQILALREQLRQRLWPMEDAATELALALARTARRCDGDVRALEDAGSWVVRTGEQMRGVVLDAIDELHRILRPTQRKALARQLLDAEERSKTEDRSGASTRSVDDVLDLSLGQMFAVLLRAQALRRANEQRLAPWRPRLKNAITAFADDDFAVRDHDIAEVPAVAMAVELLQEAAATLLPILEPEQCQALGDLIEQAVEKYQQASQAGEEGADGAAE